MADCRAAMFTLLPIFLLLFENPVEDRHRLEPTGVLGDHERRLRRHHQIAVKLKPFSLSEQIIRRDPDQLPQPYFVADTSRIAHGRPLPLRNLIWDQEIEDLPDSRFLNISELHLVNAFPVRHKHVIRIDLRRRPSQPTGWDVLLGTRFVPVEELDHIPWRFLAGVDLHNPDVLGLGILTQPVDQLVSDLRHAAASSSPDSCIYSPCGVALNV